MNARQTKVEFQRQLRLLTLRSTAEERKRLGKYIKPVKLTTHRQNSEPERIGDILSGVMDDIKRRMNPKAEKCDV